MSEEFYPMPSFPTLVVRDLVASTHWYQEMLGFRLVFEMPSASGQPLLTHLRAYQVCRSVAGCRKSASTSE